MKINRKKKQDICNSLNPITFFFFIKYVSFIFCPKFIFGLSSVVNISFFLAQLIETLQSLACKYISWNSQFGQSYHSTILEQWFYFISLPPQSRKCSCKLPNLKLQFPNVVFLFCVDKLPTVLRKEAGQCL